MKAKNVPEEAVPDLIRLVNGNINNKVFLAKEFIAFWNKKTGFEEEAEDGATPSSKAVGSISKTKMIANLGIGQSGWSKHFCQYQASTKTLTMIPYSQINGKITSTETVRVASCVCKEETANEKFRFIVAGEEIQNPVRS